ncbi:hypothetical protein SK128_013763 [Halocaridina rubra]|uniref:Uncharacterized protein n=1 Tax=Halocaridina rubra TaxID=373956 RepID=A0AAN8ZY04_HALRR
MAEKDEKISSPELKRFTTRELEESFALTEEGLAKFEAQDPNTARGSPLFITNWNHEYSTINETIFPIRIIVLRV